MHSWAISNNVDLPEQAKLSKSGNKESRLCDRMKERVLGLIWDTEADFLRFNVACEKIPSDLLNGIGCPTKREVLRVVMSVFDPLGMLSPFTLKAKILLQDIWRSGINWDVKIRQEEFAKWLTWLHELKGLKNCSVPRCMSVPDYLENKVQLHVFCDASLSAYSAAAYLRFEKDDGQIQISLVMAKSKVAPLKPLTIPRLELQAALLGSRLAKFVQSECDFNISKRNLWSDSTTVLSWIRSEPCARTVYVAHRLGEISQLSSIAEWRLVPRDKNPADDATRFTNKPLQTNDRWFYGPSFLYTPEKDWPEERVLKEKEKKDIHGLEMRKVHVGFTSITLSDDFPTIRMLGWYGILVVARRVRKYILRWKNLGASQNSIGN